jgi:hypothetical protein
MYIALSLLQKWSIKLKEEDQNQVGKVKETITKWLKDFKPGSSASDIEI